MKNKLAVVMPAYNETASISQVIASIPKTLKVHGDVFETVVVVVNDCSRDNTSELAKSAGAHVVNHFLNLGAGGATRTGMHYVQKLLPEAKYLITIDSDGQHSAEDIEKVLEFAVANDSHFIVGSRLHEGNKESMPAHRQLGNIGLSLISRVLFGIKTKDTQSGLRLISSQVLPVVSSYTIDRYGFCTEMLWLATRAGVRVEEVPISVVYTEETLKKGQSNWGVVSLVTDLLWIRISR